MILRLISEIKFSHQLWVLVNIPSLGHKSKAEKEKEKYTQTQNK